MAIIGLVRLNRKMTRTIPQAAKRRIKEAMEQSANEAVALMKSLLGGSFKIFGFANGGIAARGHW